MDVIKGLKARLSRRDDTVTGIGILGIIGIFGRRIGRFRARGTKDNALIKGKTLGKGKKDFLRGESDRIGSDSFKGGSLVVSFGRGKGDMKGL